MREARASNLRGIMRASPAPLTILSDNHNRDCRFTASNRENPTHFALNFSKEGVLQSVDEMASGSNERSG